MKKIRLFSMTGLILMVTGCVSSSHHSSQPISSNKDTSNTIGIEGSSATSGPSVYGGIGVGVSSKNNYPY